MRRAASIIVLAGIVVALIYFLPLTTDALPTTQPPASQETYEPINRTIDVRVSSLSVSPIIEARKGDHVTLHIRSVDSRGYSLVEPTHNLRAPIQPYSTTTISFIAEHVGEHRFVNVHPYTNPVEGTIRITT